MSSAAKIKHASKKENQRITLDVEAGKTYYLKWTSGAMATGIEVTLEDPRVRRVEISASPWLFPIDMNKEPLHLWCANPEDFEPDGNAEAHAGVLSEDERANWQRYRFAKQRREYLTTRVLVRTALSHYYPLAPSVWRFESTSQGKPLIVPECGLRFNLSNSPRLVVCLISHGAEVGVDAEPHESGERIVELGTEFFSAMELAQIESMSDRERSDRALSLWTLKEAYLKARGIGLTHSLNKVSFLYGKGDGVRLKLDSCLDDKTRGWFFCLLEHAGHRIAVIAQGAAAFNLQLVEMRPVPAGVSHPVAAAAPWYRLKCR